MTDTIQSLLTDLETYYDSSDTEGDFIWADNDIACINWIDPDKLRTKIEHEAKKLGKLLTEAKMKMVTAESLTGGMIASSICGIPGASSYFAGSVVTYSNEAKKTIGVVTDEIGFRAVSGTTAKQMAVGAVAKFPEADLGISVTGVAGPDKQEGRPVGCVYLGFCDTICHGSGSVLLDTREVIEHYEYFKDKEVGVDQLQRNHIRKSTVLLALSWCNRYLIARQNLKDLGLR